MTAPILGSLFHDRLRASSQKLLCMGLGMTVLGIVAIVFPMVATLAATLFVGWLLLIAGVVEFFGSFSIHGTGPFFGALLLSLLSIVAGVFYLLSPAAGAAALTFLVGALFVIRAAAEISFAFEMRPHKGWVAMLISGLISIVMAVLIVAGWPAISLILLGILLGVNFVTTGLGYIFVSRALRPAA